jgi:hypothetical protein
MTNVYWNPDIYTSSITFITAKIWMVLFTLIPVCTSSRVINILKGSQSAGFDVVPELIVKRCVWFITIPLVHIFHLPFLTGNFPDIPTIAKIQRMLKKCDEHDMKNYRPISVLSVFSKVLEKLMFKRLNSFLPQYNILTDAHGFIRGRSLETACQSCTYRTLEVLGNHECCSNISGSFKGLCCSKPSNSVG